MPELAQVRKPREPPAQWPLGIFIAIVWICWDLTAKAEIEDFLAESPGHRQELLPALDLSLSYDQAPWPTGALFASLLAATALLVLLFRIRRTLPAVAISLGLGGFLGDLLDQLPDQQLTHFIVFRPFGIIVPSFNFSELGIAVCGLFLGSKGLQWVVRKTLSQRTGTIP